MPTAKERITKSKSKGAHVKLSRPTSARVPKVSKEKRGSIVRGEDIEGGYELIATIFFEHATKPESHMTSFEKIDMIREGISKKDLEVFKQKTGLDYDQLAAILSVARATLINKKGHDKFNQTLSEKLFGLADIYSYGYEVFEDIDRFNEWIFRSNRALGNQAPYDLLDNQYGREEVKNLIGRIDYGVHS